MHFWKIVARSADPVGVDALPDHRGDVVVLRDVRQLEGGLQVAKLREGEVPTYIFLTFISTFG